MRTRCAALAAIPLCSLLLAADEPAPLYPDKTKLRVVRDAEGRERPVKTRADWERRREHILANMQRVMGPMPSDDRKVPLDVKVIEEKRGEGYLRKKITFAVEKGDR